MGISKAHDDTYPHEPTLVWPRAQRLTTEEHERLKDLLRDPEAFAGVLQQDLEEVLQWVGEYRRPMAYRDQYTNELQRRLSRDLRLKAERWHVELRQGGPEDYLRRLDYYLHPERYPTLSAGEWLQTSLQVTIWVGLAVASGSLGNAAYDSLKLVTESYRNRRAAKRKRKAEEFLLRTGRKAINDSETELLASEAETLAFLAVESYVGERFDRDCRGGKDTTNSRSPSLVRSRETAEGWEFLIDGKICLCMVHVENRDPLFQKVELRDIWPTGDEQAVRRRGRQARRQ